MNAPMGRILPGNFTIRELRAADAPSCEMFFRQLEREDIRKRFAAPHFSLDYFLPFPAGAKAGAAFAGFAAAEKILGVVNLAYLPGAAAEIAVIVRSDHQRRGIGRALLAHALHWAAGHGLSQLIGYAPADNTPMLALARAMGFRAIGRDLYGCEIRRRVAADMA
jgi:acetyltransferase